MKSIIVKAVSGVTYLIRNEIDSSINKQKQFKKITLDGSEIFILLLSLDLSQRSTLISWLNFAGLIQHDSSSNGGAGQLDNKELKALFIKAQNRGKIQVYQKVTKDEQEDFDVELSRLPQYCQLDVLNFIVENKKHAVDDFLFWCSNSSSEEREKWIEVLNTKRKKHPIKKFISRDEDRKVGVNFKPLPVIFGKVKNYTIKAFVTGVEVNYDFKKLKSGVKYTHNKSVELFSKFEKLNLNVLANYDKKYLDFGLGFGDFNSTTEFFDPTLISESDFQTNQNLIDNSEYRAFVEDFKIDSRDVHFTSNKAVDALPNRFRVGSLINIFEEDALEQLINHGGKISKQINSKNSNRFSGAIRVNYSSQRGFVFYGTLALKGLMANKKEIDRLLK